MTRLFIGILLNCILLFLLAPAAALAEDPAPLRFRTLSLADGLSQSSVQAITQDRRGFIWLGTEDGLNRYDGRTFLTYYPDPNDANSLVNNNVLALAEDEQEQLWIGTSGGLDRLDQPRKTFTHYLTGQSITAVVVDVNNEVWVGTAVAGLFHYNAEADTFQPVGPPQAITALAATEGQLWIGTPPGLASVTLSTGQYQNRPVPWLNLGNTAIQAIAAQSDLLWLGTDDGLLRLDLGTGSVHRFAHDPGTPDGMPTNNFTALLPQGDMLWIATQEGLLRLHLSEEHLEHYQKSLRSNNSIGENWIASLFVDTGGVVWIGTVGGGVSLYSSSTQKFNLVQADPDNPEASLSSNFVFGICQDEATNLWIGTFGGGLNRRDAATGRFTHFTHDANHPASLSSNNVFKLTCHDHSLWISTVGGGLVHLNLQTMIFTTYRHEPDNPYSLPEDDVAAVLPNPDGTMWVGTWNQGLALFDPANGRFTPVVLPNGPQRIWALAQDDNGRLFIGTWNGLLIWDRPKDTWQSFSHDPTNPNSLSNDIVGEIIQSEEGLFWLATADGLNQFDPETGTFKRFTTSDGLPNNTIYAILQDDDKHLWLSTNKGLSHFNPTDGTFRNYSISDGLQSDEFNRSAAFRAADGELFFGGINGYNHFFPGQVVDNPHAPPVIITAFHRFNEVFATNLSEGDTIELSYRDNFITFEFAALDFAAPEQNQFEYQMIGFDPDWIDAGTQHTRSYTNLAPGEYTFRVRASNNDGVWNETGTAVSLIITPPFWQTAWFRLTAVLGLLTLLFTGYRWRVHSIEHQNQRLVAEVEQRTAELAALLQTGQTLAATLSLEPLLMLILEQLQEVVGFKAAAIAVLEDDAMAQVEYLGPAQRSEALAIRVPLSVLGPIWEKLIVGEPVAIVDIFDNTPEAAAYRSMAPAVVTEETFRDNAYLRAWLAVPLRLKGTTLGMLALQHPQAGYFSEERARLARAFADQAVIAMENARLYEQAQNLAALEERQKLARELHDSVSQALYGIALGTRTAHKRVATFPDEGVRHRLEEPLAYVLQLAEAGLSEMRALIFELRPESLEEEGLVAALGKQAAAMQARHQIGVNTHFDTEPNISLSTKEALYRVMQEAMNNIVKHAKATQVEVMLATVDGRLTLTIQDNGQGFDTSGQFPGHLGLKSMRERVEKFGGSYRIESEAGAGTTITVIVPIGPATRG